MMSQRRVTVLFGAAVVVIAGALWLSHSKRAPEHDSVAGQPVLDGLKPALNDVIEVRVAKGDGTHATLRKRKSDWVVGEREYAADSGKVRKLLLDLGGLEVVEEKTSDPANYARIGVEDVNSPQATGTRVTAVTAKKVYSLIVGKPSNAKSAYVRAVGAQKSLLASPQIAPEADPKRWLDHSLVDIGEDRVKDVVITPASGPAYSVTREKKQQTDFTVTNIPKGRELSNPGAGNTVAGDLASFALEDVRHAPATADAGAGAAAKAAESATFRTFDGLELQIDGFRDGDRRYVAITPRSTAKETATEAQTLESRLKGWQFEVQGYKYDALFRPLEDLLKKPEPKPDAKPGKKKPAASPGPSAPPTS
jgi:hypothetical protein